MSQNFRLLRLWNLSAPNFRFSCSCERGQSRQPVGTAWYTGRPAYELNAEQRQQVGKPPCFLRLHEEKTHGGCSLCTMQTRIEGNHFMK